MTDPNRTSTDGDLFIVSAPSGTGKNTLIREVLEVFGEGGGLVYSVSYTTRSPREGEVDGENYHFVDQEVFGKPNLAMIDSVLGSPRKALMIGDRLYTDVPDS